MRLFVFDLDGTLTATSRVDEECYLAALAAIGIVPENTDWSTYEHATDAGIAAAILRRHVRAASYAAELDRFKATFAELLHGKAAATPQLFEAVPGAAALIAGLGSSTHARAAIATGAWEASARVKLTVSGLAAAKLPLATSDDAVARTAIVERAIVRARRHHRLDVAPEIVLIGDAVWDVRAAAELGLPFVGVASEAGRERLLGAGAEHVVTDYRDAREFFRTVERAIAAAAARA